MKSVYVMKSGNAYKIGVSKNPEKRLQTLATGNCDIELIYTSRKLSNAYFIESFLHDKFSDSRINSEWFFAKDERNFLSSISSAVDALGESIERKSSRQEEMMVKEDGKIYTLTDWLEKTRREIEEMAYINGELQKLLYTVQGHYVPNVFTDSIIGE